MLILAPLGKVKLIKVLKIAAIEGTSVIEGWL